MPGTDFVNALFTSGGSHNTNNPLNVQWTLSISMYDLVCLWMLSLRLVHVYEC
jgi:choline-glycine betaine transporter